MAQKAVISMVTGLEDPEKVTIACTGGAPLPGLLARYEAAGGRYLVCPICFDAKQLDKGDLLSNADLGGTVPMWQWIGEDAATTFSF